MRSRRPSSRRLRTRAAIAVALAAVTSGALAASASAVKVDIVTQGEIPASSPRRVAYFNTIQAAVNATRHGDWVLIEPGVYTEEVKVTKEHSNIWIRGMDRNTVILDGQNKLQEGGRNGIEIYKANKVSVENLTVRNFDRPSLTGPGGNEIWWNGGADSNRIGARGWYGRYLTAYDTGENGGYGIFTNNETEGEWDNIYASGFNDSGMYLGACPECKARIDHARMEDNALGYSGSNSGGNLLIENSVIAHNSVGIAPNSENPGDGPPPQNGACDPARPYRRGHRVLPSFESTEIEHCTIIRNNVITENNNLTTPSSTARAPWGVGVELPGDYADLVEGNVISNNPANGVLAFEYPNPFPPTAQTIYFQNAGNEIANNVFSGNGSLGYQYSGDVTLEGGLFGGGSTQNCVIGNTFTAATYPAGLTETWGCQNRTTPNPVLGESGILYLLTLQTESEERKSSPQPAPGPQPTMPDPCLGAPTNPLCPGEVKDAAAKRA